MTGGGPDTEHPELSEAGRVKDRLLEQFGSRPEVHAAFVNSAQSWAPDIIVWVNNPDDKQLLEEMQKAAGRFPVSFCTPGI